MSRVGKQQLGVSAVPQEISPAHPLPRSQQPIPPIWVCRFLEASPLLNKGKPVRHLGGPIPKKLDTPLCQRACRCQCLDHFPSSASLRRFGAPTSNGHAKDGLCVVGRIYSLFSVLCLFVVYFFRGGDNSHEDKDTLVDLGTYSLFGGDQQWLRLPFWWCSSKPPNKGTKSKTRDTQLILGEQAPRNKAPVFVQMLDLLKED